MQQRQQFVDGGVKRAGNAASQGPPGKMIIFFIVFTLATDKYQYLHPGLANSCGGGFQLASADGEHNAQALAGGF